jgi:hypothetical protein
MFGAVHAGDVMYAISRAAPDVQRDFDALNLARRELARESSVCRDPRSLALGADIPYSITENGARGIRTLDTA